MESSEPLPDAIEWNLDENDKIGMTEYRLKDLPKWAKEQLNLLPKQTHEKTNPVYLSLIHI